MPKSPEKMREVSDRIFHAAMELFEQKGYENTSVEEITRKAGVSKGTFFTHFPAKDAIFSAIGEIFADYMQEIVEEGLKAGDPTRDILQKCIVKTGEWCRENRKLMKNVTFSGIYKPTMGSSSTPNRIRMSRLLVRVLGAGQQKGDVIREVDPDDAACILAGIFFTVMYDWLSSSEEWDIVEKLSRCLELAFRGMKP